MIIRRIFPAFFLMMILSAECHAVAPSLGGILPRGGQRGTEVVLNFSGARIKDCQEVISYSPGFTTSKIEAVNDNLVKVTLKIAPDCRLGEHALRLRTPSGVSELRTFWVGALPVIDEKEPNSDFATPQKIPMNVTVHGVVDNEDVDYYAVEMKKGQRLSAEIEGMRLGETLFDPYIAILDSKRFELAASDDAPLLGQDAAVSILVPADGTYMIQVRESAYGGNGACRYRLHVGTFPRPTAVVPAGGRPGEEVEVRFLGDPAGEIRQKIKLPAVVDPHFGVFAQDTNGITPSPIPFRLVALPNVVETPGNTTLQGATPFTLPAAINGVISQPGEVDYYRFPAKKGQAFNIHCYARRIGSALDSVMAISLPGGATIAANDDAVGPDSFFQWTAPEDKEYILSITDHLKKGGINYFYRVEFQPIVPALTVSIPKVAQYSQERQVVVVPRGNRFATMVSASRVNYGGDLVIGAEGLPAGIKLQADIMTANLDTIPVVFEAEASAPVGGRLGAITAKPVDPKSTVPTRFEQQADMIVGNPGQSIYWKYVITQATVAVAEEAPFKIDVIEPKVPLVQNGSMNIRIVATRKPDFKSAITVFPLINLPGVGAASSAVIAEGQNETTLTVNAAGNAQVRKGKFAMLATAPVSGGPVWVSSQLANLEIASPLVALTMDRAAAEQGKSVEMFCKLQILTPFPGSAKVRILGLPTKVTAPELEITKDSKELSFKVEIDKTAPAGQHRNIFCQVQLVQNGEPIVHSAGGTELRIDVPLPPKPNAPAAAPKPVVAKPAEPAKPAEKRLSRLEKLRLEQEEREKAAKNAPAATPAPAK